MSSFSIVNAHVFDGHGFTRKNVQVDGSQITSIGPVNSASDIGRPGNEIIDGDGKYLIPGLIDCHVHISNHGKPILRQMAEYGVTTALDMGCWPQSNWKPYCDIVPSEADQSSAVTDLRCAGPAATVPGSIHSRIPGLADYVIHDGVTPAQWVSERVEEGSHFVKIIADLPIGPSQDLINALVQEAHKHGKFVVVHAPQTKTFRMAVDAQADVLTHCPINDVLDHDTVKVLAESKSQHNPELRRCVIPTMLMMKSFTSLPGSKLDYNMSVSSLKRMHEAGIPILAGSDANKGDGPVSVVHGEGLHDELALMMEAGMTELEVLKSATIDPGVYFGELIGDRGVIEVGKRADLVLLKGNPLDDIANTKRIEKVWIAGVGV